MNKILSKVGAAFKIKTKKQALIISLITFIVVALSFIYGIIFHYVYDEDLLKRACNGLFVFNFFVWLFAYFFRGIKVRYIRKKTKNYVGPLTPEEVDSFHKVTYPCNYSVMLNAFVNLILYIVAYFILG